MRKLRLLAIVGACTLATIALRLCIRLPVANSDAARYERWRRIPALYKRAVWWKKQLPQGLARASHLSALPGQYLDERERLTAALIASGYLTNVNLAPDAALTNSTQVRATIDRIRKAHQGAKEWGVSLHSNIVVITCRPQDELRCRQALQQ
jgi:hypothetical protein